MNILHLIFSVDPEGGGPIEYARVMCEAHESRGHKCAFATLDEADSKHVACFPFEVHTIRSRLGHIGKWQEFSQLVSDLASEFDVAVIHGLWNIATVAGFRGLHASRVPWVIFPHGMLDPYFAELNRGKNLRKQVFWTMFQGRMLSNAKAVLFTCEEEQRLAENAFVGHQVYNAQVVAFCASDQHLPEELVADGRVEFLKKVPKLSQRPYFLFLSRIHPKKACDILIEAYAAVSNRPGTPDLVFAGPDQTGWSTDLQAMAKRLRIDDRIHWAGMIGGATKSAAFAGAEAFVLPSHQENFGLVVAEALSTGTPVLISDKVNIWREIEASGAGLVAPDTVSGTIEMLEKFLMLSKEDREVMRHKSRACYEQHFSTEKAATDLAKVLIDSA